MANIIPGFTRVVLETTTGNRLQLWPKPKGGKQFLAEDGLDGFTQNPSFSDDLSVSGAPIGFTPAKITGTLSFWVQGSTVGTAEFEALNSLVGLSFTTPAKLWITSARAGDVYLNVCLRTSPTIQERHGNMVKVSVELISHDGIFWGQRIDVTPALGQIGQPIYNPGDTWAYVRIDTAYYHQLPTNNTDNYQITVEDGGISGSAYNGYFYLYIMDNVQEDIILGPGTLRQNLPALAIPPRKSSEGFFRITSMRHYIVPQYLSLT